MHPESAHNPEEEINNILSENPEKLAKQLKWILDVNAKQSKGRATREWFDGQIAGTATEVIGSKLPLEYGTTVFSAVKDDVAIEIVPISEVFTPDAFGRITKARVLRQAFDDAFKGWNMQVQVKKEEAGKETDEIVNFEFGPKEKAAITDWMVYTPNWNENISEHLEGGRRDFAAWKIDENKRRQTLNKQLEAEGKPPYKIIEKNSYTMRDWFNEENARREMMGEPPLHEPQSGILQEGTTMPDALTLLKDSKEIVGFTEVKAYTFEELKELVVTLRKERERQIAEAQETNTQEIKPSRPIATTVKPEARIDVGNGAFNAGVNLLGEERMINNIRGQLYGKKGQEGGTITTLAENTTPTDLAERTFAVLRFLEAPTEHEKEYDELLVELGNYIHEYGYQNVLIQKIPIERTQVLEKAYQNIAGLLTTEDESVRKVASGFSDIEIKTLCDLAQIDFEQTRTHIRQPFKKRTGK